MIDKVRAELTSMEAQGIIEPVDQPTDWVSTEQHGGSRKEKWQCENLSRS